MKGNKKFAAAIVAVGILLILVSSGVLAQPSVHDVAGTARLNGNQVPVGTAIVAKDANGTERGTFVVSTKGIYGFLHMSGDDSFDTGKAISFFVNGTQADQTLSWQPFGYNPNFSLTACDLSTYSISVQTDSQSYYPGSSMTMTGSLMNSHCSLEPGKAIAYSVPGTPIMGQIQTNGTGYFSSVVAIPSDAIPGNYTLWASYPPLGSQTVYATANFTVTVDKDGDGFNVSVDCNDTNPAMHPGAVDICGNGIDEDCSGADAACFFSSGGSGGGSGGSSCTANWTCAPFSECQSNGTQTRVCSDANKCGTSAGKPAETQSCTYTPPVTGRQCTQGTRVCSGSDLMECSSEGTFVKIQTCEFGCSGDKCLEGPGSAPEETGGTSPTGAPIGGLFLLEPSAWPYWIVIAIVIILIAWYLMRRKKKPK